MGAARFALPPISFHQSSNQVVNQQSSVAGGAAALGFYAVNSVAGMTQFDGARTA